MPSTGAKALCVSPGRTVSYPLSIHSASSMSATTRPLNATQSSETKDQASTPASAPVDNVRVVRRLIEQGFNRGNLDVLDEVLEANFVEHQSLPPGVPPNRAAVAAIIRALRTGFPDLRLSIESIDGIENRVWVRLRATGTNTGPFMGNPPTGRKMSIDVMDSVRMHNGRIAEHWGVPDHGTLFEQLGL
jgi:predicted SnoaL-like aldol condensation-catalyzing enzyme